MRALSFALSIAFLSVASAQTPRFEVASIKLCEPGEMGGGRGGKNSDGPPSPVLLDVNCQTAERLIQLAYVGPSQIPITGGPDWIHSERYRVEAKAGSPQSRDTMTGPMLQALLEDRFHLQVRRESKDVPVYEMTAPTGAAKLKPAKEGQCVSDTAKIRAARQAGQEPTPCGIFFGRKKDTPGIVTANTRGVTLASFAADLSHLMDRPVVDKSGIAGAFDLYAEFVPDESTPGLLNREIFAPAEGAAPEPGPSMIPALQQLGLKLERALAPRDFLVIDHIERPSEN